MASQQVKVRPLWAKRGVHARALSVNSWWSNHDSLSLAALSLQHTHAYAHTHTHTHTHTRIHTQAHGQANAYSKRKKRGDETKKSNRSLAPQWNFWATRFQNGRTSHIKSYHIITE